jgi:hypothetical protein
MYGITLDASEAARIRGARAFLDAARRLPTAADEAVAREQDRARQSRAAGEALAAARAAGVVRRRARAA